MPQRIGFEWLRSPSEIARSVGINANTVKFMAQDWHRLYEPFVPKQEGFLRQKVNYKAKNNTGIITHLVPYAHYQYTGEHLKHLNPLASAYWDKAAEAAGRKAQLISDVERYMKSGR